MRTRAADFLLELKVRAAVSGCRPLAFMLYPSPLLRRRRGQNTVEYILLLAVVASMSVMMGLLFHKRILGGIFTMVGLIIGAGAPK